MSSATTSSSITVPTAFLQPREQRYAYGKSLRESIPRSSHANWKPATDRPDIIEMMAESNKGRLPELIPLRFSRMLDSPLAFYRGSANIMASDLSVLPRTNIRLQTCGDCHLQNFGWFASPERNLVFDVNDFDETRTAPWEWDIKRLVASVVLAARGIDASKSKQQSIGQSVAKEYRERLAEYEAFPPLEMWYVRMDADSLLNQSTSIASKKRSRQIIDAARQRTLDKLLPKLTEGKGKNQRFKENPPLIFHPKEADQFLRDINLMMHAYRATLADERRSLLDRYQLIDVAYKVVGVGSVGLRCGIILMLDSDDSPLVLQIKEARASVLEKYVGKSQRAHHGHRIVHGQRVMQAASDIFLGWTNDTEGRSYYIRQLRDMKMSANIETMSLDELEEYGKMCGWALARAHAKSGDVSVITGYLGTGTPFDEALGEFGIAYAIQAEQDFETLQAAFKSGRIFAAPESHGTETEAQ